MGVVTMEGASGVVMYVGAVVLSTSAACQNVFHKVFEVDIRAWTAVKLVRKTSVSNSGGRSMSTLFIA